ncbi:hypothetical protein JCM16161A_03120 [Vulcanisaeta sp. JCM 16161]|uniref:hypothetical protein n=1 Tax=Vulcanisaeta sp. JCM 16161 TaxID=1295372 RepID=UPI0006D26909|nr:hypothetical protein [Vulcanisaeta sp. JCM 16161]
MDGIKLGFAGRSSTWNLLRKLVFPEHVALRYVSNEDDCLGLNFIIVERYMADLVNCSRVLILSDPSIDGIIETIVDGLGLNELNVGIDIGNSRCGAIILANDTPLIHVTLSFVKLIRMIRRLAKRAIINLVIGTSPGVSDLVRDFMESINDANIKVRVINEDTAYGKKNVFRSRYPYLTLDELDGLVYAYTGLTMGAHE